MNTPIRMALDVPALGTAISDEGDAYVDSLAISVAIDGKPPVVLTGTAFEAIMTALRLRHLCFHPRTRAFTAGSMKAPNLVAAIDRHWSSIDGAAYEIDGLRESADTIRTMALGAVEASWTQTN